MPDIKPEPTYHEKAKEWAEMLRGDLISAIGLFIIGDEYERGSTQIILGALSLELKYRWDELKPEQQQELKNEFELMGINLPIFKGQTLEAQHPEDYKYERG